MDYFAKVSFRYNNGIDHFLILKNLLLLKLYSLKSKIAIDWYGGCGTVGRVVASDTTGPWFKSRCLVSISFYEWKLI